MMLEIKGSAVGLGTLASRLSSAGLATAFSGIGKFAVIPFGCAHCNSQLI